MYYIINWVDISPPYAWVSDNGLGFVDAGDSVTINANVWDYCSNVSYVYAEVESPDETVVDTVQLFDDGLHYDDSAGDGVFGNSWVTDDSEMDYYIDLNVSDIWNNSYTYNNSDKITTNTVSYTHLTLPTN